MKKRVHGIPCGEFEFLFLLEEIMLLKVMGCFIKELKPLAVFQSDVDWCNKYNI